MRGGGIKLQIIANSPAPAHLLDVTRTVSRAGLRPTGIDRIERAYITRLADDPAPLFGLVRTRLGFMLLDRTACQQLLAHCDRPMWQHSDLISRLSRRKDSRRGKTETGLRRMALDRSTGPGLTNMLKRHLPRGTVYLNTGQTNFDDRIIHALRACDTTRIAIYLHDTIPLDLPEVQTPKSCLAFKRFFNRVDRHADIVMCNSKQTKAQILSHAATLEDDAIHILWPGQPAMTLGAAPVGPWTGKPYFVVIGTIEPRKNIGFLLDLWHAYTGSEDPHLVLCGRRGWMNKDVFARLDTQPRNVHELSDLDDSAMWALLENSNGLLFPSRAEGFGYPAIEAAALDVPVICTPLPVFQEVLGEYPVYASESARYLWHKHIEKLARKRRDRNGDQYRKDGVVAPQWQMHFNKLFTVF